MTGSYCALGGMIILVTFSQIALKKISISVQWNGGLTRLIRSILSPGTAAAGVAMMAAPVCYFIVLRTLPLVQAYALAGITYITVPLAGAVILKENYTWHIGLGSILIVSGILLISWRIPA